MDTNDDPHRATAIAGSLRLNVWYDGDLLSAGASRHRYHYQITDWDSLANKSFHGTDLESGLGEQVDARRALMSLVSFLSAAADAYRSAMNRPGWHSENLDMFPAWVSESACMNDDELAAVAFDSDREASLETARERRAQDWPTSDPGYRHPSSSSGPSM